MTTLTIGIATVDQYRRRTLAIARGDHVPHAGEPKIWFSSIESFAKILSDRNRELLRIISQTKPNSLTALAESSGRAASNLSRTLKTMERYGLVHFEHRAGRERAPRVGFDRVALELTIAA